MPITTGRSPGSNPSPNLRRLRLEFREGTSSKFWIIELENPFGYPGVTTTGRALVHWGRIGSRGAYQTIDRQEGFRRLASKEHNGYQRVGDWTEVDDPMAPPGDIGAVIEAATWLKSQRESATGRARPVIKWPPDQKLRPKKSNPIRRSPKRAIDLD